MFILMIFSTIISMIAFMIILMIINKSLIYYIGRDMEISDLTDRLAAATAEVEAVSEQLTLSEDALSKCEESNSIDRTERDNAKNAMVAVLLELTAECALREVHVAELRSTLEAAKRAEVALKMQVTSLSRQLEDSLAREKAQIEARSLQDSLRKSQKKRKPWYLFFWPF